MSDDESDSFSSEEDEDQEVEQSQLVKENKVFEELVDLMNRGLVDDASFKGVAKDIDSMRSINKIKMGSMNRLLVKSIFVLTARNLVEKMPQTQTEECYKIEFLNVLGRYKQLLNHKLRHPESHRDAGYGIKSAFHDLSSRPYVSSVLQEFLKTVSISDASVGNLGDYIKIVTKEVEECKCNDWPMSAVLTQHGGILQNYMTNDYLEVPANAVPEGEEYLVCGRSEVELSEYHHCALGHRLVAAVANFHIHGNMEFKLPVHLYIRHTAKTKTQLENIHVRCQHIGQFSDVPSERDSGNKSNFFSVDQYYVKIITSHFSKYFCFTHGNEEDINLSIALFGSLSKDANELYLAHLMLCIYLRGDLLDLGSVWRDKVREQNANGRELIERRDLNFIPDASFCSEDTIEIAVKPSDLTPYSESKKWEFLPSETSSLEKINIKDINLCMKSERQYRPICLDYKLTSLSGGLLPGCITVSITKPINECEQMLAPKSVVHFVAFKHLTKASICDDDASSELLKEKFLWLLSEHIPRIIPLGICLGFSRAEVDYFRHDEGRNAREKIFELLCTWNEKLEHRSLKLNQRKEILKGALLEVECAEAVLFLGQYCSGQ